MRVTKQIEHRSEVKVTTIWAIAFEAEVVETSGWFQNVSCQNTYQKCRSPHDVRRTVFASRDVK